MCCRFFFFVAFHLVNLHVPFLQCTISRIRKMYHIDSWKFCCYFVRCGLSSDQILIDIWRKCSTINFICQCSIHLGDLFIPAFFSVPAALEPVRVLGGGRCGYTWKKCGIKLIRIESVMRQRASSSSLIHTQKGNKRSKAEKEKEMEEKRKKEWVQCRKLIFFILLLFILRSVFSVWFLVMLSMIYGIITNQKWNYVISF